jgi:hypothetical protein
MGLLNDPSADLLLLSGLVVLALAITGRLSDRTDPTHGRRWMLGLIAALFLALGFLVHSNYQLAVSAEASDPHQTHRSSRVALGPATLTFSSPAVDKYLGRPSSPPDYYGEMPVTAATFLGTWTNVANAGANGIQRIEIESDGGQLLVHAWGGCAPGYCDWGEQRTVLDESSVRVTLASGRLNRRITLTPLPWSAMQVEVAVKSSGPSVRRSVSLFAKTD